MSDSKPLALVTGVGPGTGGAVVRRFAEGGYRVAMLARDADRLAALATEIPDTIAIPCDVSDADALKQAIDSVGAPKVVVHNAVGGAFGTFSQIDADVLQRNFEINTMALFHLARLTTPAMIAAGEGALVVTGNTSAQRGRAAFAGFAPGLSPRSMATKPAAKHSRTSRSGEASKGSQVACAAATRPFVSCSKPSWKRAMVSPGARARQALYEASARSFC